MVAGHMATFAVSFKKKDMQKKMFQVALAVLLAGHVQVQAQDHRADSTGKRWFIGSTLFLLGNFATINNPGFFQINVGYRITEKDVLVVEPKTWKYAWPNGIHPFFNAAYGKEEERFPGYIREYGMSVAYQRFLWKGVYAELNVMPTLQHFFNNNGVKVDDGFQLFNTYRVGYHIRLFRNKFFIQPSIAVTHRALHTKMPDGFRQLDDKWSKFVFGEPGFHIGFNF